MDNFMEKLKKIDRKYYIAAAAVLVLIIGFFIWNSNKKIDLENNIKVTFSGYNGQGTATVDTQALDQTLLAELGKKNGLSDTDLARMKDGDTSYDSLPDMAAKAEKTLRLASMVEVKLDKERDLKNGDKVTLKLMVHSNDVPIKPFEKEITVSGLKKVNIITINDIKKDLNVKFDGLDGIGVAVFNGKKFKNVRMEVKDNGKLKNGDKAKISLYESAFNSFDKPGRVFSGKKSFEVKVSGLKDPKDIKNLKEVIDLTSDFAKSKNKSNEYNTYKLELIGNYIQAKEKQYSSGYTTNTSTDEPARFNVVSLYKVTHQYMDSEPDVSYEYYGYSSLTLEGDKFNIGDKNVDDDGMYGTNYADSLSLAKQKMGSKGILIK